MKKLVFVSLMLIGLSHPAFSEDQSCAEGERKFCATGGSDNGDQVSCICVKDNNGNIMPAADDGAPGEAIVPDPVDNS